MQLLEERNNPSQPVLSIPALTFELIIDVVDKGSNAMIDQQNLESLLVAAKKNDIKCVLKLCGEFMLENISLEKSIMYYKHAGEYLCIHTKKLILHYIQDHFKDIIGLQSVKVKF